MTADTATLDALPEPAMPQMFRQPRLDEALICYEYDIERYRDAWRARIAALEQQLAASIEAQKCECGPDDACRFAIERDEARKQLAAAMVDGERYRWMRPYALHRLVGNAAVQEATTEAEFDAAIDAAIQAGREQAK